MVVLYPLSLQVTRILTREAEIAENCFSSDRIETLLHLAMLVGEEEAFMTETSQSFDVKTVVEAQKCLSNLLSLSATVRRICQQNSLIEGIMLRLRMHPDPKLPQDVKSFDMLMLFLFTAHCPEVRTRIEKEFHGLIYLMEALDLILKNNAEYLTEHNFPNRNKRRSKGSRRGRKSSLPRAGNNQDQDILSSNDTVPTKFEDTLVAYNLDNWEVDFANKVLKILFNLTINIDHIKMDDVDEAHFYRLVSILHDFLLCETRDEDKRDELQNHIVNLLTNMPCKSYEELMSKISELGKPENPEFEFDEMNMEVIAILLRFLNSRLDKVEESKQNARESLSSILGCFIKAASAHPIIRKYLRYQILPPLKDIKNLPEKGDTIRNKLVRLMTSPDTMIKSLSASFVFILCKERPGRMIKYTGFGNAAGLLSARGLLGYDLSQAIYSSDSDESDTEEYMANYERFAFFGNFLLNFV